MKRIFALLAFVVALLTTASVAAPSAQALSCVPTGISYPGKGELIVCVGGGDSFSFWSGP